MNLMTTCSFVKRVQFTHTPAKMWLWLDAPAQTWHPTSLHLAGQPLERDYSITSVRTEHSLYSIDWKAQCNQFENFTLPTQTHPHPPLVPLPTLPWPNSCSFNTYSLKNTKAKVTPTTVQNQATDKQEFAHSLHYLTT